MFAADKLDLLHFQALKFKLHVARTSYGVLYPNSEELGMTGGNHKGLLHTSVVGQNDEVEGAVPCGMLETAHPILPLPLLLEKSVKAITKPTRAAIAKTGRVIEL